jgi:hypothetical protein
LKSLVHTSPQVAQNLNEENPTQRQETFAQLMMLKSHFPPKSTLEQIQESIADPHQRHEEKKKMS